jgi:hypothetical protein
LLSFSFTTSLPSKATTDHTLPTGNSKGSENFSSLSILFAEIALGRILSAVITFNARFAMERTRIPQAHCNVTAFLVGLVIPQPAFHYQCHQWKL